MLTRLRGAMSSPRVGAPNRVDRSQILTIPAPDPESRIGKIRDYGITEQNVVSPVTTIVSFM